MAMDKVMVKVGIIPLTYEINMKPLAIYMCIHTLYTYIHSSNMSFYGVNRKSLKLIQFQNLSLLA